MSQRAEPCWQRGPRADSTSARAGSGARMKLVVNLVLGLNRAVLAEGLSLAEACGIDPPRRSRCCKATPAYSAAMDTKGPKMVARDFRRRPA